VTWQFVFGNWLNSSLCIHGAQLLAKGVSSAFDAAPYWARFTLCLDPYWVNQWLKNYGAGFVKRGFIGGVLSFFGSRVDLLLLNLLSFLLLFGIAYLLVFHLVRLLGANSTVPVSLWVVILWMGPFGKTLSETAGDPVQIVLLIWLAFGAVVVSCRELLLNNRLLRDLVAAVLFCVSVLIYEGSFLLFLVPFFLLSRRTLIFWLGLGISFAMVLKMSSAESLLQETLIAQSLVGFNPFNGLEVAYRAGGGIASQVSFVDNFWMELSRYIRSPIQALAELVSALSVFGIWVISTASLILFGLTRKNLAVPFEQSWGFVRRFSALICVNMLVIFPFLFVTHDWVRYFALLSAQVIIILSVEKGMFGLDDAPSLLPDSAVAKNFVWVSFLSLFFSVLIYPKGVDLRTSLPPGSRIEFFVLAFLSIVSFIWCCSRSFGGFWRAKLPN
jgi:hypothetical protein